jgi:hypothetical protein
MLPIGPHPHTENKVSNAERCRTGADQGEQPPDVPDDSVQRSAGIFVDDGVRDGFVWEVGGEFD